MSSGKKAQRSSRNTAGKRAEEERYEERTNPILYYEIFLWLMLALSIFLFISLIGIGGFVGEAVSSFCFGCFGVLAYLLPFLLFFMTAFLISNQTSHIAKIKAASTGGLYLVTCGFMQLLLLGYTDGYDLMEYYQAGVQYKTGGGLIGGLLVKLFCPAIGVAGAYVTLVIMAIICIVLISQRSLFSDMKRKSTRAYQAAKEGQARRREQEWLRQETSYYSVLPKELPENRTASLRLAKRVSGVTPYTDLSGQPRIPSDEIQQVLPKTTEETLNVPPVVNFSASQPESTDGRKGRKNRKESSYFQSLEPLKPDTEENQKPEAAPEKTAFGLEELKIENRFSEPEEPAFGDISEAEEPEEAEDFLKKPEWEKLSAQEEPVCEAMPETEAGTEPGAKMQAEAKQEGETARRSGRKPRSSEEEIKEGIEHVEQEIEKTTAEAKPEYIFPPIQLLKRANTKRTGTKDAELRETAQKLQQILHTFGVNVKVTNASCGPSVTRYELMPEMGVKVSKIVNLADDIKLNLAAADIRIEAPIPGKAAVGIEVPNKESSGVLLRDLLESEEFRSHPSNLAYAVGKDIAGKIVVADIAKMPHLLIAGATGSGKSVFINTLIMSIIYKAKPEDVKMIMIDPKVVELSVYNGIPHLFIPVVTDPKKAAGALNWGVAEMMKRYELFANMGVRDLKGYNARVEAVQKDTVPAEGEQLPEKLPQVVIIVDELADLMMVASGEVEDAICRLAQLARAAGIHLVIATQRPSVDVITGLIKANMPSRIAFSVSSGVDSRTILDMNGAEKLLGNGDMLFAPQTYKKPARIQGAFVSDKEVSDVVEFLKEKNTDGEQYKKQMEEQIAQVQKSATAAASGGSDVDELFADAGKFIIEKDKASIGMLQRWFKIGFNRAARIMDQLSEAGVVGPEEGTKPRKVLMSMEQFENYLEEN
ncbi:MAG: DNA translocase FtsK 4TM domain-containing protein [Lachnospiraceae bacterium]|nr:DNA translocase FtsK 4TM domain-containing protein [Lachnospiraceae bacterium]